MKTESDRLLERIEAHPFVHGMKPEHVRILADSAMEIRINAGEPIFNIGDLANRFYLIFDGQVAIESRNVDAPPVTIQTLGPGDVLGWSWLFPPFYWNYDARAIEPVRAVFFYGTRLRERAETDRDFGYELMKRVSQVMLQRLHSTRHRLLELAPKG